MTTARRLGLGGALAVAVLAGASRVGADTRGAQEARTAFRELVTVEESRPPKVHGTREAEEANIRQHEEWRRRFREASAKFHTAFAASDWEGWPATVEDGSLLERGLLDLGDTALATGETAIAVRAYDRAAQMPALSKTGTVRVARARPVAHLAGGDPAGAADLAEAAAKVAEKEQLPAALTIQGDIECALGRTAQALAFYRKAAGPDGADEGVVFGAGAVAALEARWKATLLGRSLGTLRPEWAEGQDAEKWVSKVAGRVLVLAFPNPYAAESVDGTAFSQLASRGAVVAGVLTPSMTLRLPETFLDYPTGSSPRLRGESQPADLREWAARLRRVAHLDFPVVGLAPADLPLGKAVLGSAVLVDREGRIAYFMSPAESVACLRTATERLLAPH